MSNNDRSKWDYYFDMNILSFLNTVSFFKDKVQADKEALNKARKQWG